MKIITLIYNDEDQFVSEETYYYCSKCGFQVDSPQYLKPYVKYEHNPPPPRSAFHDHMLDLGYSGISKKRGVCCEKCIEKMKL